jgi:hypothetical protein
MINNFFEFPLTVNVQAWKRQSARVKSLAGKMQQD